MADQDGADPRISDWFDKIEIPVPSGPMLTQLVMASRRYEGPVPDQVLSAWHQAIARSRRITDQSEVEFIDAAQEAGWTWSRIAAATGQDSVASVKSWSESLRSKLLRSNWDDRPWTETD